MYICKRFRRHTEEAIKLIKQHGITETDNFRDEVIFCIEEWYEEKLPGYEIEMIEHILKEKGVICKPISN